MENQFNNEAQEEEIDLKKYVTLFTKNWLWFVLSLIICLPLAFAINRYSSCVYSTTATILVNDQSQYPSGVDEIIRQFGNVKTAGKKNLETEIGVLQSYYITRKTIEQVDFRISYYGEGKIKTMELYHDAPFKITLDTSHTQLEDCPVHINIIDSSHCEVVIKDSANTRRKMEFGSWFVNNSFAFQVMRDSAFATADLSKGYFFKINNLNQLAKNYQSQLKVELVNEDATIINLSIKGNLAQKNITFLNQLSQVYIRDGMDDKNQIAVNTINFIDGLLNKIIDSLQIAESDLQHFRQNNRIVDLTKEGAAMFDKLEAQQDKKSILEIRMKYYDYLLKYIEKKKDFKDVITPSIMGIDDQLLNKLVAELSGLYQERRVMEYSVKSNNPQLDVIDVRIKNTVESLIEVVTNIIQGAKIERDEVNSKVAEYDDEIKKLPLTEREMIKIKRKFDLNDNIFNFLQQKRAEAGITSASNVSDGKVLDKASIMSTMQNAPKRSMNYIIALVLALLLPAGVIVGIDFFNTKLRDLNKIENDIHAPIIGLVSHNKYPTELVVHDKPQSIIAESFRTVRTNLKYVLPGKEKAVIAVTSTVSGEGKTFCAVNLASILALSNKKILLVGLDLRKPKVHHMFDTSNDKGMSTYLIGNNTIDDIIIETGIKNLHLIVAGPTPPNPSELIESEKTAKLIEEARSRYDYVIIDTSPVALVADAFLFNHHVDLNIFVVRYNYSVNTVVSYVNALYNDKKLQNLGILINDVDLSSNFSYGSVNYGHYGSYGKGYGYYVEESTPLSFWGKVKNTLNRGLWGKA